MARIQQPRQKKDRATCRRAIETTGEVFSDGTALELIRFDSGPAEASLLWWDGNSATIGQHFDINGRAYRPLRLDSISLQALRLPGHMAPYGSTRDLFNNICQLVAQYTDIAEGHVSLITYFVLGSWLADRLPVAPFLFFIAPLGTPRAQLLRLLSCLCRRPLMLADVTPAAISGLASLRPTFLLDEPSLNRRLEQLLYATNCHGRCILRRDQIAEAFSPKVIFSREPLRNASLVSQALQITFTPASRQVPFLEDSVCGRIADEFQSKLLQFRLTNLGRIRTPEINVSELADPLRDVARAFGTCVADDKDLQLRVIQLLRERDQDAHFDPSTELESVILEGLLFCCHTEGRSRVLSGELADVVNMIWEKRGEGRHTTPESVGWKLRALDFRTEPIDGAGKGLRLTEAVRGRIHSLAQSYTVASLREAAKEDCSHCKVCFGK